MLRLNVETDLAGFGCEGYQGGLLLCLTVRSSHGEGNLPEGGMLELEQEHSQLLLHHHWPSR